MSKGCLLPFSPLFSQDLPFLKTGLLTPRGGRESRRSCRYRAVRTPTLSSAGCTAGLCTPRVYPPRVQGGYIHPVYPPRLYSRLYHPGTSWDIQGETGQCFEQNRVKTGLFFEQNRLKLGIKQVKCLRTGYKTG